MFKKLFGRREEPKRTGTLLFVCLRSKDPLDWESVRAELEDASLTGFSAPEGEVATFEFANGSVHAAFMPIEIPQNEVGQHAPHSRFWKKEESTDHQAHLVLIGASDDVAASVGHVSHVARAVSITHDAVAWYYGNGGHILHPGLASDFVKTGMLAPIWVNVVYSKNPRAGADASTLGLEYLGHNEFEIIGTGQPASNVYELLIDVSDYVLQNGPILKHGQTFGRTADERFPIEFGRSKLGKKGAVIRLSWP